MHDDPDDKAGEGKKADDADVEMPDYGGDDDGVEVIEDDDEETPATREKRKPEGSPESSAVGAAANGIATKKMPKPSEPAPRRKVQKIVRYDDSHERDVPLQLQPGAQAYIGPEHILKVPVRPMNERLVEISHCLSNHLREPGLWSLGKRQCL